MTQRPWWKAYFVVVVVLTAIGTGAAFVFADEMAMTWPGYSFFVLYVIQLVGLFGFVYRRGIAHPLLWRLVFLTTVVSEFWDIHQTATDTESVFSLPALFVAVIVFVYLIQIPMWFGLFQYGFRSKALWHRAS